MELKYKSLAKYGMGISKLLIAPLMELKFFKHH